MTPRLVLGDWRQLGVEAFAVRKEVFVLEQNIPLELEQDEMDPLSLHAVAYDADGGALGTGRLLPDGHIGRMAVRRAARGQGIGAALLLALMEAARQRGDAAVLLNAQIQVEPFYQRYGFTRSGPEFPEAGIPHVPMRCPLTA